MKVVILCGGRGTRLREETEFKPKPMVNIGARPILWHIIYKAQNGYSGLHWQELVLFDCEYITEN